MEWPDANTGRTRAQARGPRRSRRRRVKVMPARASPVPRPGSGPPWPSHQTGAGNLALRVALTQTQQCLAILMHLDAPAVHRLSPAKPGRVAMDSERSRRPSEWNWLHYADPALAPMCRSSSGSYVPVGDSLSRGSASPAKIMFDELCIPRWG